MRKIGEDGKKIAAEALESCKKDLEKPQKVHDEDLKLIENLRKKITTSLPKLLKIFGSITPISRKP
jgi:hypothetical protein